MDFPECPIPDGAKEVIRKRWRDGSPKEAHYLVKGQQVAIREWHSPGILKRENGVKNGLRHGHFRRWYENGNLEWEATYVLGIEHGLMKQYEWDGRQIGSYTMDHGTGLDLWFNSPGVLIEEREYVDGDRHGYEHQWETKPPNQTISKEGHYLNGLEHGIFRRWNDKGRLSRGYPQYFVNGQRVTKRQYLRACKTDSTLPPFVLSDNQPFRTLPQGIKWIQYPE